jgi:hypothetical protein
MGTERPKRLFHPYQQSAREQETRSSEMYLAARKCRAQKRAHKKQKWDEEREQDGNCDADGIHI